MQSCTLLKFLLLHQASQLFISNILHIQEPQTYYVIETHSPTSITACILHLTPSNTGWHINHSQYAHLCTLAHTL